MLRTQAKLGASCGGARVAPFGSSFCGARRFSKAAGARTEAKWTMMSRSYITETDVGENESADLAIQRFQRACTNTLILNELRRRRRVMTKIEAIQAKQNEKGLIKKLNVDPPSWKEEYGDSHEPSPFADYFSADNLEYADMVSTNNDFNDEMFFDSIDQSATSGGFSGSNLYNNANSSGYMSGGQYGGNFAQGGGQYGNKYPQSGGQYGSNYSQGGGYFVPGTPQPNYPQQTPYPLPPVDYPQADSYNPNQQPYGGDAPNTY